MKSDIRVCAAWESAHERPVYTLGETCPECGANAVNSAPAPFDPEDRYGEYRRRARQRAEGDRESDGEAESGEEATDSATDGTDPS